MLQRIQTVHLGLSGLVLGCFLVLPATWQIIDHSWADAGLVACTALSLVCAVCAIFLFKRPSSQIRVIVLAQVGVVLLAAVLYGSLYLSGAQHLRSSILAPQYLISVGAPAVVYVLLFLARRGVARDIRLVRSADRLR